MFVEATSVLAVDQVPITEVVDDVVPAHITVEIAKLVKAEEALQDMLSGGDQLVNRVRRLGESSSCRD